MSAKLENNTVANKLYKIYIPISKKGNLIRYANDHKIFLVSHTRKIMLRIIQLRLKSRKEREISHLQDGFRKKAKEQERVLLMHVDSCESQNTILK